MRVVFWANRSLGRETLACALREVLADSAQVTESLDHTLEALAGAHGLIVYSPSEGQAQAISAEVDQAAPGFRWVHSLASGHAPLLAARWPQGTLVTASQGAVAPTVAEHVMAVLLGRVRQLSLWRQAQQQASWQRESISALSSLEGQHLVIVGSGFVAKALTSRALAFGMRVSWVSRSTPRPDSLMHAWTPITGLNHVLPNADALVLAIASSPETQQLVGAAQLALLPAHCMLVNVSRGDVLDEIALQRWLTATPTAAAHIDVAQFEPLPPTSPLWRIANLTITPHCAGYGSLASGERIAAQCIGHLNQQLKSFYGRP